MQRAWTLFGITISHLLTALVHLAGLKTLPAIWPDNGVEICAFYGAYSQPQLFWAKKLLKTCNLFGLQYIYRTLTNSTGKDPLDFPTLKNKPAEYEVVIINALTGKSEYFGKETMVQDDYRLIMASSAIPATYRPLELDDIPYFDGGLLDAIPVSRTLEKGCDRLVVILSKMRDYVRKPQRMRFLYIMRCRQHPQIISLIDH